MRENWNYSNIAVSPETKKTLDTLKRRAEARLDIKLTWDAYLARCVTEAEKDFS